MLLGVRVMRMLSVNWDRLSKLIHETAAALGAAWDDGMVESVGVVLFDAADFADAVEQSLVRHVVVLVKL